MPDRIQLPPEVVVVRCGIPPFGTPTKLLLDSSHHSGVFGFSVQAAVGVPLERLASWCPNKRIGVTTVAELASLGYDVVVTRGRGYHATLVVPEEWTQDEAERLARKLRDMPNPYPGDQR